MRGTEFDLPRLVDEGVRLVRQGLDPIAAAEAAMASFPPDETTRATLSIVGLAIEIEDAQRIAASRKSRLMGSRRDRRPEKLVRRATE